MDQIPTWEIELWATLLLLSICGLGIVLEDIRETLREIAKRLGGR